MQQETSVKVIQWTINKKVDPENTSFLRHLPGIKNETIKNLFGKLPAGCNEKTKYSGYIVVTNEEEPIIEAKKNDFNGSGIYTLYCANGEWRIGGFENNKFTHRLAQLIHEENKKFKIEMKVVVYFSGDRSVGLNPYSYNMEVPVFEEEDREETREMIKKLYVELDGEFIPKVIFEDEQF